MWSRRLRRSSGRASNRACVSSFFCKLMDARVKLHMERTVLFVHICVPPSNLRYLPWCRGPRRFASESSARTHAHTLGFLSAHGSLPSRSEHSPLHTRVQLSSPPPAFCLSAQQLRLRREHRTSCARASGGRHSWRRDDSDEHANRTGPHRSHLCSHVTIGCSHVTIGGTARPGMHLAHFVLGGGSFACARRRAEDLLRAADQRARGRHVRGLLLCFSQLPFLALPPRTFLDSPTPPVSRQVGLGNIFPLISDAADSNAATSNTPAVRARALLTPPALAMSLSPRGRSASSRRTRYPSPRTLSSPQVASRLRHDAPEFVPPLLKAPASCPDAPEIAPSATRSAPNEADLLPALDSGREKLLSSTESEDALKESKLARTLAIILYLSLSSYRCSRQMLPPSEALLPAPF